MRRSREASVQIVLPIEIWGEILSWLQGGDLFRCASICRAWCSAELVEKSVLYIDRETSTHLTGERLKKMCHMQHLELDGCHPRNYDAILSALANLRALDLIYMACLDGSGLTALRKLGTLILDNTALVAPETLLQLPALHSLAVGCENRTIDAPLLQQMTNLTSLSLFISPQLPGTVLTGLTNLKRLDLWKHPQYYFNGSLGENSLSNLTNLTSLLLDNINTIMDKDLRPLCNLKSLSLDGTPFITTSGVCGLSSLTKLVVGRGVDIKPVFGDKIKFERRHLQRGQSLHD